MTVYKLHIGKYDWNVAVYDGFTCESTDVVVRVLESVGCRGINMTRALRNMEACELDTGLTFSDGDSRVSVIVVYRTTSGGQHINTLSHEAAHVCQHIAREENLDPLGEEICGLYGDLMQAFYEKDLF